MTENQPTPPFFIIKTIQDATGNLTRKAKTYGDKLYENEYVKQAVDTGMDLVNRRYKHVADAWIVKGRDMKKDAIKRVEEIYSTGKKNVMHNALVERVEKRAKEFLTDLPTRLNLPNGDFIIELADKLEKIDRKVDEMHEKSTNPAEAAE